jgi:enterochelin esterase family protein
VATLTYRSKSLGQARFLTVYTPPGYETSGQRYPVLDLLHGNGNRYDTWASADAGLIFDNLLAKRAVTPMVVVMPHGHVAAGAKEPPPNTPAGAFGADFLNDIMPMVESRYRIRGGRNSRAIVGLSMGAGHTAAIGFARLDLFSHIGLMSGVGLDREGKIPAYIPAADVVNGKLKMFWMGRGKTENLEGARAFSKAVARQGHHAHLARERLRPQLDHVAP